MLDKRHRFSLSHREYHILEQSLFFFALSLNNNITRGKKEKSIFVESTTKADYVVTALKGTRASKDEKKQILIPKSDAIVEEILNKLESDKAQTKSPSVAELEDEINGLV